MKDDGGGATVVPRLVAPRGGRAHEIEMFSHYVGTYLYGSQPCFFND
jgi:hypothetical protein